MNKSSRRALNAIMLDRFAFRNQTKGILTSKNQKVSDDYISIVARTIDHRNSTKPAPKSQECQNLTEHNKIGR